MYSKGYYHKLSKEEIKRQIQFEGFNPILISNLPGYIYHNHTHPEIKLLAFISGTMQLTVDGITYECEPGDRVLIKGDVPHSAVVGLDGCTFYWSEKLV